MVCNLISAPLDDSCKKRKLKRILKNTFSELFFLNKLDFLFGRVVGERKKSHILIVFYFCHLSFKPSSFYVIFHFCQLPFIFCINNLAVLKQGGMSILFYYINYHLLRITSSLAIHITCQPENKLSRYHGSGWIGCGG